MTWDEITERIKVIESAQGEPERAYGLEDELRRDFIEYVSRSAFTVDMREMAKTVLSTESMDFERSPA